MKAILETAKLRISFYEAQCLHCGKVYNHWEHYFLHHMVCQHCKQVDSTWEARRVLTANLRTRYHHMYKPLPATLTLPQWLATIYDFDGYCAYCETKHLELLEHFMPTSHRGGTTVNNVLPTCMSCNNKKLGIHPDKLMEQGIRGVPGRQFQYLQEYLAARR